MKEYKLSRTSKYSVLYLLSGLFMFFFMFAILHISSYAVSPSTRSLSLAPSESYSETYGSYFYSYNPADYDMPITTITTSTGGSGYTSNNYTGTVRGSNTVHLVTSVGDYVVNINQGLADVQPRTVSVLGVPQRAYAVFDAYNNQTSAVTTYATFSVNSISVSNAGRNGLNASNYSDYSSYSPINSLTGGSCDPSFYSAAYKAGDPLLFSFSDLNTTNLTFIPSYLNFSLSRHNDIMCVFTFSCTSSSNPISSFQGYFGYDGVAHPISLSDLDIILYNVTGSTYRYLCIYRTSFDLSTDFGVGNFIITGFSATPISDFSFSLLAHKYTIADYMQMQNDTYDYISPNVFDLVSTTSANVSDISSVQMSESGTFDDFNLQLQTVNFNSFTLDPIGQPMTFISTIISGIYNRFPPVLVWVFLCVMIFGIVTLLLSTFGRVGRRFKDG